MSDRNGFKDYQIEKYEW